MMDTQNETTDKINKENWHAATIETPTIALNDEDGSGRPLILREFSFAFRPDLKILPSKQQLFNAHVQYIKSMLWADGLEANEDVVPRVVVGKKRYKIFVLCELRSSLTGRRGTTKERPKNLKEIFDKK